MMALWPQSGKATTLNELKVEVRVVDFLQDPPRGRTPVAIVYDPQIRASFDDAIAMFIHLQDQRDGGKAQLFPILTDVRTLAERPDVRIGFIAQGMEQHYGHIFDYARDHHMLTISADLGCVRKAQCMVGVAGAPRVEVIISQQAASAGGIAFTEAFRMMVTEN